MRLALALLAAMLTVFAAQTASACRGGVCTLGERTYRVAPPPGWDGATALPVLIHLHGWGRTGKLVLRNKRIAGPAADHGLLLVAPDGLGRSWSFWTASRRRDVDFLEAVLEDLPKRFPIQKDRVMLSGFSYGGAMVWRTACALGDRFHAYLPIAGALWDPEAERCATGPVKILHVHGQRDTVMDPPDDGAGAMRLWRRVGGLSAAETTSQADIFTCRDWAQGPGHARLCFHRFGHVIPRAWLGLVLPELLTPEG